MTNNIQPSFSDSAIQSEVQAILRELFSFHRFGIRPGLHNIEALCQQWGNPQKELRFLHIAGTNGKGSTSTALSAILSEGAYKVGLYTSPHIRRFNERIRIGKQEIPDAEIARLATEILPFARSIKATFFEITTAMALRYFANEEVDVVVLETGMGGRLDSTNIVTPELSIITSIDFDHTAYLGNTLEAIAGEKAGIIKKGKPVLVAESRASLRGVFWEKAAEQQSPLCFLDEQFSCYDITYTRPLSMSATYRRPKLADLRLQTSLCGEHQARNIATALGALHLIRDIFPTSNEHCKAGLASIREYGLRGRIELLRNEPPLVLDVAHNPAGIRTCVQTLLRCGYPRGWNVIFGAMEDKDITAMIEELRPIVGTLHAVAPAADRAAKPQAIEKVSSAKKIPTNVHSSVAEAVKNLLDTNAPLLIIGSFYVADEAAQALGNLYENRVL